VQEVRVAEESVRKDHCTDQDIQDGEEGDEDSYSAPQEITPNQHREIVKIENQGDLLNEVGADEGGDENDPTTTSSKCLITTCLKPSIPFFSR